MDVDSQKCPDCGKPFQSPTGAEAVCECSKSPQQQPTQPEGGIVYLLPCPKCGDQKYARPALIGKAEKCQCGYEFRYSIVLSPIRPEPLGWMPTIQHHATDCTQKTLHWWRQSAVPWIKRTVTYIREHITPRVVAATKLGWRWLIDIVDSIGSLMAAPPKNESTIRDDHKEQTEFKSHPLSRPKTTNFTEDGVVIPPLTDTPNSQESNERIVRDDVRISPVTPTSNQRLEELFTEPQAPNANSTADDGAPAPQWRTFRQLALQMLKAGVFAESYSYASKAIELEPTDPFCWATKGLAAAYLSQPPDFRLNELTVCINEAIKSKEVQRVIPSLQEHIFTAAKGYRQLIRKALAQAHDDAQKETLASNVDVGLQLTLRNRRVDRIQNALQATGYMSSVDAIMYARNLDVSLFSSKKALADIDEVLWGSSISTFRDPDGVARARQRVLAYRATLIADIQNREPTFRAPDQPQPPGCFIATAATGDANHPYVTELRLFRDTCLTTSNVGRRAIQGYYCFSPRFACVIAKRPVLQRLVYLGIVCPTALAARAMLRIRTSVGRSGSD